MFGMLATRMIGPREAGLLAGGRDGALGWLSGAGVVVGGGVGSAVGGEGAASASSAAAGSPVR